MNEVRVGIIMGSDSDLPVMQEAATTLREPSRTSIKGSCLRVRGTARLTARPRAFQGAVSATRNEDARG